MLMRLARQPETAPSPVNGFHLEPRGPVSGWPQRHGEAAPRAPRRAPDGDIVIRWLTAVVVLAVAAFAAIVSYSHIYWLGTHHGQDGTAARLLPLSIDGLIAAASLVMLHAVRNKQPVPRLARWMLGTGVAATVAANVIYGLPATWISPVVSALIGGAVSAFPAIAFIGSVEMMVGFVRNARRAATGETASDEISDSDSDDEPGGERHDEVDPSDTDSGSDEPPKDRRQRQETPDASDKVRAVLKRSPRLRERLASDSAAVRKAAKEEVAQKAGVSLRSVERVLREMAGASS